MKDVIDGELHLGKGRVPNQASVPLNGDLKLELFEHCSASVRRQPRVQQYSYQQNLSIEHEFSKTPTMRVPIYSVGQMK